MVSSNTKRTFYFLRRQAMWHRIAGFAIIGSIWLGSAQLGNAQEQPRPELAAVMQLLRQGKIDAPGAEYRHGLHVGARTL